MLYGCDGTWWRQRDGVPEFKGLKLSQDATTCAKFLDVHKVTVERDVHQILLETPGLIGSGQNGGFQALNLAVQFGARRVILVAFDMCFSRDGKVHWHGRHGDGLSNPRERTLQGWREKLDGVAKQLRAMGVEVVNASPVSALTAYPKMTLPEALDRFTCQLQPA